MAKYLRFSICEQSGRTFNIPLDKALELIKQDTDEDTSSWNECDIADYLYNQIPDMIEKYEKENCYYETHVQDEEIYDLA